MIESMEKKEDSSKNDNDNDNDNDSEPKHVKKPSLIFKSFGRASFTKNLFIKTKK